MPLYICRPFHKPNFKISASDDKLLAALRLQYGKYISESPVPDTYDIEITAQTENPLAEIDEIIFSSTIYDASVLALHGSAVEWNGRAYLFLAAAESGKTTLASYLASSGFGYITDDCILIDRSNFQVHPYNCPVHLRDGGLEVLKSLGKVPAGLQFLDNAVMSRHIYTPQNCITEPLPLGGIYFLERSETENSTHRLSTNESIAELMKSPIINYEITPDYLELLARFAKETCRRLIYTDMDFVAETIRQRCSQTN